MDSLEREYHARISRLPRYSPEDGKIKYGTEMAVARQLFAERFGTNTDEQSKVIDAILQSPNSGFANLALIVMIDMLARQGQSRALETLLSQRCPEVMFVNSGIEDYLIITCRDQLPDGVLVLCNAYDRSSKSEVRQTIARALRRGFEAAGISSQSDPLLVAECRRWYEVHKDDYEPNLTYRDHFSRPAFPYEKDGVMIERN